MRSYSLDLRVRVLAAADAGERRIDIAERFSVSVAWVRRLVQRRRETGSIEPKPHAGGPALALDESHRQHLRELVEEQRDATLKELRDRLGLPVSIATIWRALDQLGFTRKRSPNARRNSRDLTSRSNDANTKRPCRSSTPNA